MDEELCKQNQREVTEKISQMPTKEAEMAKERLIGFLCGMAAAMTNQTEAQSA